MVANRLAEHEVHELDDRRLLRERLQIVSRRIVIRRRR